MPYFNNGIENVLFIHIPKTGGTSVEHYLSNKILKKPLVRTDEILYGIIRNETYINYLKKQEYRKNIDQVGSYQHQFYRCILDNKELLKINTVDLRTFCIVRNPYTRFLSDMFYLSRKKVNSSIFTPDEIYFKAANEYFKSISDNHVFPQYMFISDENGELFKEIKILKFENLDRHMKLLGYIDFNESLNIGTVSKDNYFNYLNMKTVDIINNYYGKDFELFGYKKINTIEELEKLQTIILPESKKYVVSEDCNKKNILLLESPTAFIKHDSSKIGLLTRCKNEPYITEFVKYYISQGVDIIYILDDESTKNIYKRVRSYENVCIIYDKNIIKNNSILNVYKKIKNHFDWLIYVDVDEFITTKKNISNTIREELETTFKNAACIKIPWVMMSCNSIQKNPRSLLKTNVYRWNHDNKHENKLSSEKKFRCRYDKIESKCIFKPKFFENIKYY